MIFFCVYIIIGSACVAQHAVDICLRHPDEDGIVWLGLKYIITWPWWVFKQ